VARLNFGIFTAHHGRANNQGSRSKNIALFAVGILQQSQTRCAVRIIFDRDDLCRHAIFVALEINNTVATLVTAANPTARYATAVIAATAFAKRRNQALFRLRPSDLGKAGNAHLATSRRCWFKSFYWHRIPRSRTARPPLQVAQLVPFL